METNDEYDPYPFDQKKANDLLLSTGLCLNFGDAAQ